MSKNSWDITFDSENQKNRFSFRTLWQYRDLLLILIRRDFISFYKQTILGPIWFFIKPIFSAIVYLFIFGEIAGLSTDGIPPALFYISGVTAWSFFQETVAMISDVLKNNAGIFGKVYFPRLIMPFSIVFSNLIKFSIQLILIFCILTYYLVFSEHITISIAILLLPVILLVIALQALGLGLLVASISVKYRDFSMLIGYSLQLGLFVTPVVYPLSSVSGNYFILACLNPMALPIELFKFSLFGTGYFPTWGIIYLVIITILIFIIGLLTFNRAEKTFVDTI